MRTAVWLFVALAGSLAAGCSTPGSEPRATEPGPADDLLEVAGLLRDYTAEFRKGPARLADVAKHEPLYTRGYQAVKSGAIVVVWGVPMVGEGAGTAVIAYEKKPETEGRNVLLQDGTIKRMTAEEFKAAPRAK